MTETVLFVGGTMDGRWLFIERTAPTFSIQILRGFKTSWVVGDNRKCDVDTETYNHVAQPEKTILSKDEMIEMIGSNNPLQFTDEELEFLKERLRKPLMQSRMLKISEKKILPEQIIDWQGIYDHRGNVLAVTEENRKFIADQINHLYCGIGSGKPAKVLGESPAISVIREIKLWSLIKKYIFKVSK
jgi:hypothetical protein